MLNLYVVFSCYLQVYCQFHIAPPVLQRKRPCVFYGGPNMLGSSWACALFYQGHTGASAMDACNLRENLFTFW